MVYRLEPIKALKMTIKRYWFDLIVSGKKLVEYREYKEYYFSRIDRVRGYDEIWLYAGGYYDSNKFPFARIQWDDYEVIDADRHTPANREPLTPGDLYFAINTWKILETRNTQTKGTNHEKSNIHGTT